MDKLSPFHVHIPLPNVSNNVKSSSNGSKTPDNLQNQSKPRQVIDLVSSDVEDESNDLNFVSTPEDGPQNVVHGTDFNQTLTPLQPTTSIDPSMLVEYISIRVPSNPTTFLPILSQEVANGEHQKIIQSLWDQALTYPEHLRASNFWPKILGYVKSKDRPDLPLTPTFFSKLKQASSEELKELQAGIVKKPLESPMPVVKKESPISTPSTTSARPNAPPHLMAADLARRLVEPKDTQPSPSRPQIIDLEDDEVLNDIYKSAAPPDNPNLTCFGMVRTKLLDVDAKYHPCRNKPTATLPVRLERKKANFPALQNVDERWLVFETGFTDHSFGRIEDHTVAALLPLVKAKQITQLKLYVPGVGMQINSYPIYLNIYGSRENAFVIGKSLSQMGVTLSSPTVGNVNTNSSTYFNPHMVNTSSRQSIGSTLGTSPSNLALLPERGQIEELYKALRSGEDLAETEPSKLCATSLYPHQKQALTFLLERESDPTTRPSSLNIWNKTKDFSTQPPKQVWMCILNNKPKKEGEPNEVRGGIIADEMGLGKTLMIISLILSDLKNKPRTGSRCTLMNRPLTPGIESESEMSSMIDTTMDSDDARPVDHPRGDYRGGIPPSYLPMPPHDTPSTPTTQIQANYRSVLQHVAAGRGLDSKESRAQVANLMLALIGTAPAGLQPLLRMLCSMMTSNTYTTKQIQEVAERIHSGTQPRPLPINTQPMRLQSLSNYNSPTLQSPIPQMSTGINPALLNSPMTPTMHQTTMNPTSLNSPHLNQTTFNSMTPELNSRVSSPVNSQQLLQNMQNIIASNPSSFLSQTLSGMDQRQQAQVVNSLQSLTSLISQPKYLSPQAYVAQMMQARSNSANATSQMMDAMQARGVNVLPVPKKKKPVFNRPGPHVQTEATLIVCPLTTVSTWEEQILEHTKDGALKVYVYHGPNRLQDPKELANFDVVLTTYNMVGLEHSKEFKSYQKLDEDDNPIQKWHGPLHSILWSRIVLDEAHVIKDPSTQQSKGCCHLHAVKRWCMTGTPIQNKLDDLYALLKFLRMDPFDDKGEWNETFTRLLKGGNIVGIQRLQTLLKIITLRRTKTSTIKGKPILTLPPKTENVVAVDLTPSERELYVTADKYAADVFKALVDSDAVMKNYIHVLEMALRLRQLATHPALCNDEQLKFQTILSQVQASGAADLMQDEEFSSVTSLTQIGLMFEAESAQCCQCDGDVTEPGCDIPELLNQTPVMSRCHHLYCRECWLDACKEESFQCTICSKLLRKSDFIELKYATPQEYSDYKEPEIKELLPKPLVPTQEDFERAMQQLNDPEFLNQTFEQVVVKPEVVLEDKPRFVKSTESAKITALINDLTSVHQAARLAKEDVPKSIVFSQWTNMLDIVAIHLDMHNIKWVRLDGGMSRMDRKASISTLRKDPSVLVMLVSLKAGGVGLNLTMASRAYLMEPYWNPAVEAQAIDRIHRLGQTRPVYTIRYIVRDSIEERILDLQKKKMSLANMALEQKNEEEGEGKKKKKRKRTVNKEEEMVKKLAELRSLFSSR